MSEELREYVAKMREWQPPSDPEVAHWEADDLLVAALKALRAEVSTETSDLINQLLEAYGGVPKWYA